MKTLMIKRKTKLLINATISLIFLFTAFLLTSSASAVDNIQIATDENGAAYTLVGKSGDPNISDTGNMYVSNNYPQLKINGGNYSDIYNGGITLSAYKPNEGPHGNNGLTSYSGAVKIKKQSLTDAERAIANTPSSECYVQITLLINLTSSNIIYDSVHYNNEHPELNGSLASGDYCGNKNDINHYKVLELGSVAISNRPSGTTSTPQKKVIVSYTITSQSIPIGTGTEQDTMIQKIKSYPNVYLVLKDSSGNIIKEIETSSRSEPKEIEGDTRTQRKYQTTLQGIFDGIGPGTYTACLKDDNTACSDSKTKTNENLNLTIKGDAGITLDITTTDAASKCGIDGIGWILCPVLTTAAKLADGAFKFISDNFLETKSSIFDSGGATEKAWQMFRNIANIAFVIVFLIIIFSQITSFGITNYGIKKLLPKLIISAILVNLSFFICQIAVDLSNILGFTLQDLFTGMIQPGTKTFGDGSTNDWTAVVGGTIMVGAGLTIAWLSLAALIPALLAAIVSGIMILFILIGRQAIIILLVIVSPLAFVAFLLPNTEKLFKKWMDTLKAMLLLFPIIAVVFGVSKLASSILQDVFNNAESAIGGSMGKIAAGLVLALPLFAVPGLLKSSLDGIGKIGGQLSGLGDKWGKSLGAAGTKRFDRSAIARGRRDRAATKSQQQNLQYANRMSGMNSKGTKPGGGFTRLTASGLALTQNQRDRNARLFTNASAVVAGEERKQLEESSTLLEKELSTNKATDPDFNSDSFLESRAKDQTRSIHERRAALHTLGKLGRDGVLRRLGDSTIDPTTGQAYNYGVSESDRQSAISANAGALVSKAPDMVKGEKAAFENMKGGDLVKLSSGSIASYMDFIKKSNTGASTAYTDYINAAHAPAGTYTTEQLAALSDKSTKADTLNKNTLASFRTSIEDIRQNKQLQSDFGGDIGKLIKEKTSDLSMSSLPDIAAARTKIDTDGKIR